MVFERPGELYGMAEPRPKIYLSNLKVFEYSTATYLMNTYRVERTLRA